MGKREKELQAMEQLHQTQLEARDREIARLRQENLHLSQHVEALKRQEASVLQAIVQARETAAGTVGAARQRAQEIYASAVEVTTSARDISENARSIISQAEENAAEIMKEAHDSSTRIIAKANERSAFIQNEARVMLEEYQSLMDNARSRLRTMMLSNIENMRDFAAKLTVLYSDGIPDDLEPLLEESVHEIELHLKQIGTPPSDRQPTIGYTDAKELVKAIHRMQGRDIPNVEVKDTIEDIAIPILDDEPDEERVWTVDEVIRASSAGSDNARYTPPDRSLDYETDESLGQPYAYQQRGPQAADTGAPPYAASGFTDAAANADAFEGLNLRNTGHSDLKATRGEYENPAPVLRPERDEAFNGYVLMGQSSKLESTPKETAFDGLNLRQGGHSTITADLAALEGFGAEAGIMQAPLQRTKERETLPEGFSMN